MKAMLQVDKYSWRTSVILQNLVLVLILFWQEVGFFRKINDKNKDQNLIFKQFVYQIIQLQGL